MDKLPDPAEGWLVSQPGEEPPAPGASRLGEVLPLPEDLPGPHEFEPPDLPPVAANARQLACQRPGTALWHAREVDRGPHPDTREAVLRSPKMALYYAIDVDQGARDDTRAAACGDPVAALHFAERVDRQPGNSTRLAASQNPHCALDYAVHVDRCPHPVTWEGAQGDKEASRQYAEFEGRFRRSEEPPEPGRSGGFDCRP